MTNTDQKTPTEEMYDRGFGTGHPMDLRPTQVKVVSSINAEGYEIHNVLQRLTKAGQIVGALEPIPFTMCGLNLARAGTPYNEGRTTCSRCATLAAYKIVAIY